MSGPSSVAYDAIRAARTPAAHAGRGRRRGASTLKAVLTVILSVVTVIHLFPIAWMIVSAFKPASEVIRYPATFLPSYLTLENFEAVFTEFAFGRYFLNSVFLTSTTVVLNVLTGSIIGYVFAKFSFPAKNTIFLMLLATMMIPFPVRLLPSYQLLIWFNWLDRYVGIIAPQAIVVFTVFFMRQFIYSIPDDFVDAARIDAAGEFRIYFTIIIPLCAPAIVTIGILRFVHTWDDLLWPLIVLSSQSKFTLPVGLALFQQEEFRLWGPTMAGAVVSVVPTILVFIVLQRYFVENIALSGVKG